jgi:hypothetical protein
MATLLEWMKPGQLVAVNGAWWFGEIVDVAQTTTGAIMICINSPKAVWHGHAPEWLEYKDGQIAPTTPQEARRDIQAYTLKTEAAQIAVKKMGERWDGKR